METVRVQNPFPEVRAIPDYPAFGPMEIRDVSPEDAAILTNGSGLVIVTSEEPAAEKPKKARQTTTA